MNECMYVCMNVCINEYMYACMHISMYICTIYMHFEIPEYECESNFTLAMMSPYYIRATHAVSVMEDGLLVPWRGQ